MVRAPLHFHGRLPVPEVSPLTYRDGVTHLELVYELSEYLKKILHPSLQSTVDQVVSDTERLLDEANTQFVDGVQEFQRIHDRFMSDVNASLIALNDSAVSDLVDDETSLLGGILRRIFATKDELGHIDADKVFTVGQRGDYQTINEALSDLSKMKPLYHSGGTEVELRLLSGFTLEEQVVVNQQDFGWVTLTAEDAVVPISRAAITSVHHRTGVAAFVGAWSAVLPKFSCMFEMDESGEYRQQIGCAVYFNSSVTFDYNSGIRNCAYRGINVQQNSQAILLRADFSGAGNGGIRVANGSSAAGAEAIVNNCGNFGLSVNGAFAEFVSCDFRNNPIGINSQTASVVSATRTDVSGSTTIGAIARDGGILDFSEGVAEDCDVGVEVRDNGYLNAHDTRLSRSDQAIKARNNGSINAVNAVANDVGLFMSASSGAIVNFSNGQALGIQENGVSASDSATVVMHNAQLTGNSGNAVTASNGTRVNARGIHIRGGFTNGIRVTNGSHVNISGADVRLSGTESNTDIVCQSGSTINATGAQGGSGKPANELSSTGVLYR